MSYINERNVIQHKYTHVNLIVFKLMLIIVSKENPNNDICNPNNNVCIQFPTQINKTQFQRILSKIR